MFNISYEHMILILLPEFSNIINSYYIIYAVNKGFRIIKKGIIMM